ncbi:hypothetical protein CRUP_003591 [Coryphaenoides rupestris]|nr:hypothetical protein CRUP_003591 [Coryphaenoides rupestris]
MKVLMSVSSRLMYLCSISHSICSLIIFFFCGRNMFFRISTSSKSSTSGIRSSSSVGSDTNTFSLVRDHAPAFRILMFAESAVWWEGGPRSRERAQADSANIKILNAGAWSRTSEKVFVSLPTELEDLIPEVEDFYKKNHSGRKLHWHHLMSNGINLKLATELPDAELRRTLWSLVAFPKLKRQVLSYEPPVSSPKDFSEGTLFYVNQEFSLIRNLKMLGLFGIIRLHSKNSKVQKRGKINLIGRLQLTTERMREEENEGITELVEILKNMFLPQKKMIKEQMEWLIEHKYIKRDETDINTFIYMA